MRIKLKNHIILIDKEDVHLINNGWYVNNRYVIKILHNKGNRKHLYLHRLIMKVTNSKYFIDHINGNPLDNRKCNLRICSKTQNTYNKKKVKNKCSSKYKGVSWREDRKKWRAYISIEQKQISLGHFENEKEAAKLYNKAAIKYFGEFARINKI